MRLEHLVGSGRELSDELTEPCGAPSSLVICKSWNRGYIVLLPHRRAASLSNALVALARIP